MTTWDSLVYNTVENGPIVQEAVFNYSRVSDAIDSISEIAGFIWNIDKNKKLWFTSLSTVTSGIPLTASDISNVSVDIGNTEYRNVQYIKGGTDITDVLTESFKGDGEVKTWSVGFPIALVPTLYLNTVLIPSTDVGIKGLDTGKKYYWNKSSNQITQDQLETVLTSSDILRVDYQGLFDIVVVSANTQEIERMALLEGSTGRVEEVEINMDITNREASFEIANAKLKKYAQISKVLTCRTQLDVYDVGMLVSVEGLEEHNFTDGEQLLVNSISTYYEGPIKWNVLQLVSGPEQASWTKIFENIVTKNKNVSVRTNIREDEILISVETNSRTWELVDDPNIFIEVYAAADLYPSTTLFPMFKYSDRIKYIELLDAASNVLVRKQVIKQIGEETGVITSTFYVNPFEGNGDIVEAKVYGGIEATATNGSGVLHTTFSLVRTKTSLEALQITLTDTRNFTPDTGTFDLDPYLWTSIDDSVDLLTLNSI